MAEPGMCIQSDDPNFRVRNPPGLYDAKLISSVLFGGGGLYHLTPDNVNKIISSLKGKRLNQMSDHDMPRHYFKSVLERLQGLGSLVNEGYRMTLQAAINVINYYGLQVRVYQYYANGNTAVLFNLRRTSGVNAESINLSDSVTAVCKALVVHSLGAQTAPEDHQSCLDSIHNMDCLYSMSVRQATLMQYALSGLESSDDENPESRAPPPAGQTLDHATAIVDATLGRATTEVQPQAAQTLGHAAAEVPPQVAQTLGQAAAEVPPQDAQILGQSDSEILARRLHAINFVKTCVRYGYILVMTVTNTTMRIITATKIQPDHFLAVYSSRVFVITIYAGLDELDVRAAAGFGKQGLGVKSIASTSSDAILPELYDIITEISYIKNVDVWSKNDEVSVRLGKQRQRIRKNSHLLRVPELLGENSLKDDINNFLAADSNHVVDLTIIRRT